MNKPPRVFIKNRHYWLDYYADGKRIRTSTGIIADKKDWKTSRSASAVRGKIKEVELGRFAEEMGIPDPNRYRDMELEELLHLFLHTHSAERFAHNESTIKQYEYAIGFIKKYIPRVTMLSLTREQVMKARLAAKDHLQDITVRGYLGRLNTLFNFAEQEKFRADNPVKRFLIRVKLKPPRIIAISDEYKVFTDLYKTNKRAFAQLFFQRLTAFRVSEVCNLKKSDIDRKAKTITYRNPKGSDDLFPLYPLLERVLKYEEKKGDFVFYYRTHWSVSDILKEASAKILPVPYTTHQLKRAYSQEINNVQLPGRFFDQMMHHAPQSSKTGMDHYAGKNLNIITFVLTETFAHWAKFLDKLEKKK